ncbi:class 3 adenylate cyclase [Azomonas agilis]|uniref:Class 3 adenylate cyclase n=1 Tax=Azomonas agilis TaxID=116849 RepID=A0A562I233_9GAMM|nr:class 3 adenylate cyclase [Azomonas agilis]
MIAPPLREYHLRLLAYLIGIACLISGAATGFISGYWLLAIPSIFLYVYLAYVASLPFRERHPQLVSGTLLCLDTLNTSALILLLQFATIPSLMFLLVLGLSALLSGGIRQLALITPLLCGSCILGYALLGPYSISEPPTALVLTSVLTSIAYVLVTAYCMHELGLRLAQARRTVKIEQEKTAQMAQNLAKYLSPQVWQSIFDGQKPVRLETKRKKLSVFFSDIKGFTELSEELEAEVLTQLLNTYLNDMANIALYYGGTIDKFIGDAVMIFFGDPSSQGVQEDALAAVSMALAMRKHMDQFCQQSQTLGFNRPMEIRMGISTGYCTVGNFGADTRMDYTIIGREVNLASRLENAAKAGEILIAQETYQLVRDKILCADKGKISIKGFSQPVQVYQVVDFRPPSDPTVRA